MKYYELYTLYQLYRARTKLRHVLLCQELGHYCTSFILVEGLGLDMESKIQEGNTEGCSADLMEEGGGYPGGVWGMKAY